MRIRIRRLAHGQGIALPSRASAGSAGMDLRLASEDPVTLAPGERRLLPTGIALEIPLGWEAQIRPRSGLALKHGLGLVNSPGTIDSDYRGEVGVLAINHGQEPVTLEPQERIAQLVVAPVQPVEWEEVDSLEDSHRGPGGFGSTGSD